LVSIITNTREVVGHVLSPAKTLNSKGFSASSWGGTFEVVATAVNAIHIKLKSPKTIFSILPTEFLANVKNYRSYFSSPSSIVTDINAGEEIFGGKFAPFVGNKIWINGQNDIVNISTGDVITIAVELPEEMPREIIFENRFNGEIKVIYNDNDEKVVGHVLKPVVGVGRFEGSKYVTAGRIRANHPGVIDISVSPDGFLGGFQIIPATHAQSPDMIYARTKTQWMVVSLNKNTGEGKPPLFRLFLKPSDQQIQDGEEDWLDSLLSRYLVLVQMRGSKDWVNMPIFRLWPGEDLPDKANTALSDIAKIKILFPIY